MNWNQQSTYQLSGITFKYKRAAGSSFSDYANEAVRNPRGPKEPPREDPPAEPVQPPVQDPPHEPVEPVRE